MDEKIESKIKDFIKKLEDQIYFQRMGKEEFCKKMGITTMTLYNWRKGNTQMSLEDYYKALEILGLKETISEKK